MDFEFLALGKLQESFERDTPPCLDSLEVTQAEAVRDHVFLGEATLLAEEEHLSTIGGEMRISQKLRRNTCEDQGSRATWTSLGPTTPHPNASEKLNGHHHPLECLERQ